MKKKIWIITLFPDYFLAWKNQGVLARSFAERFDLELVQIRDYGIGQYKAVDDIPFGGGAGMVMRPDVLEQAFLQGVVDKGSYGEGYKSKLWVCSLHPRGKTWDQKDAENFSKNYLTDLNTKDLVFICGRYEGIDERFLQIYVNQLISVGDFILTGGELPTMCVLDSCLRLVNGVLGNEQSLQSESFNNHLLEYPLFTRPREFHGQSVPEVLISGHHKNIEKYQKEESERVTKIHRPDLWEKHHGKSLSRTSTSSSNE